MLQVRIVSNHRRSVARLEQRSGALVLLVEISAVACHDALHNGCKLVLMTLVKEQVKMIRHETVGN
jgi:hypothetical protein